MNNKDLFDLIIRFDLIYTWRCGDVLPGQLQCILRVS